MTTPSPNENDDKKIIEQEEKEQMLNVENKVKSDDISETTEEGKDATKAKQEAREGREVKPKKIPIGGIQMPGFFTRSRSKEKCKEGESEQGEVEGTELLEPNDKDKKEESLISQARIKLPNPFRKSKTEDEGDKSEGKERKKLIDAIRLPLVSVKKKKKAGENAENQTGPAGLASTETLDETDKTADRNGTELKNIPLDDKKDSEKQELTEEPTWKQKLKAYRIAISALLAFILITIIIVAIALPSKNQGPLGPLTRDNKYVETITTCGKVEGIMEDSSNVFRGIPYARPPIGKLRFKEAQPLDNIDYCWNGNTTFLAHNATDVCIQILSNGTVVGTEDCLTLDIVTPYVRYENPLPVVVLIGAETLVGGSPGKMRPSARYARSRDVVFVRPNFRMGSLGFLALDILSKATYPHVSGNYGLSDIIQALKWIQNNIEHFGGDKHTVTLFGHRAGATLVTALATIPGAEKLFTRVWSTSGSALYPKKNLTESEADNKNFLTAVDCQTIECLYEKSADTLVLGIEDVWRKPQPDLPTEEEKPDSRHEWLVIDGKILQNHPAATWTSEQGLKVKLVVGTTAHSAASEKLLMKYIPWTEELVSNHVADSLIGSMGLTEQALKMYNRTFKGLSTMVSDIRSVCPLFAITSQMQNATFYVATQPRGENDLVDVDSDVDAILGRYEPKTPDQRRYVSTIQNMFYYYVWHGEIQKKDSSKILIIGQDSLPASSYSHCGFWIQKDFVPKYSQLD